MPRISPGVIPIKDQNPYETIRCVASSDSDIEEHDIVAVSGYTGDVLIVSPADATTKNTEGSALYIARTGSPAGRALWIQPWRVATRVSTEGAENSDPVFLGRNGKFVFSIPENEEMWYTRRVGTVIDSNVIHFHLG